MQHHELTNPPTQTAREDRSRPGNLRESGPAAPLASYRDFSAEDFHADRSVECQAMMRRR